MSENKDWKPFRTFVIVAIIIVVVSLGAYFSKFYGGLSSDHAHWGEFGNYFGVIAGVISSVGIFITLYFTLKNNASSMAYVKWENFRNLFFDELRLYQRTLDNIEINGKRGEVALNRIATELQIHLVAYFIFTHLFPDNREENRIINIKECSDYFDKEILKYLADLYEPEKIDHDTFDLRKIYDMYIWEGYTNWDTHSQYQSKKHHDKSEFYSDISDLAEKMITGYDAKKHYPYPWFEVQILNASESEDIFDFIAAYQYVGTALYTEYAPNIGAFLKMAYNTMDILHQDYNDPENETIRHNIDKLHNLFKAQVSSHQAAIFFFDSFSENITEKTIDYYYEFQVCNAVDRHTIGIGSLPDNLDRVLKNFMRSKAATPPGNPDFFDFMVEDSGIENGLICVRGNFITGKIIRKKHKVRTLHCKNIFSTVDAEIVYIRDERKTYSHLKIEYGASVMLWLKSDNLPELKKGDILSSESLEEVNASSNNGYYIW